MPVIYCINNLPLLYVVVIIYSLFEKSVVVISVLMCKIGYMQLPHLKVKPSTFLLCYSHRHFECVHVFILFNSFLMKPCSVALHKIKMMYAAIYYMVSRI